MLNFCLRKQAAILQPENNRVVGFARACRKQLGYTLIEILVVLFIISIVTTVALLSIKRNDNKDIENFAREISQIMTLAEEQAMLQSNVLGLTIKNHQLQFTRLQEGDNKQPQNWQPLQDHVLNAYSVPSNMQVKVDMGHSAETATAQHPQIIISSNGNITPFTIYLGKKGEKPLYAITGDADGHVTTRSLS